MSLPHQQLREPKVTIPRILFVDHGIPSGSLRSSSQLVNLVTVEPGIRADRLAATGSWDALIIGVDPDVPADPFSLARRLRVLAGGTRIPLATVCNDDSLANRVAAVHAGADLFLPKPLSRASLDDAITMLAARARTSRPHVLVVDDDHDFACLLAEVLRDDGIDVEILTDPGSVVDRLRATLSDAVLLDIDMPSYDGIELCGMLRANREYRDLTIIILTGHAELDIELRAYQGGCDDYFRKPVNGTQLCTRLRARIERTSMSSAAAERDHLTALPVRRVFVTRLESRVSEALRRQQMLSVCVFDIDHFKAINDRHGHLAGDRVLAWLGALLSSRLRSHDLCCRWGGDEFAIAFPGETAKSATAVVDRLLAELSAHEFETDDRVGFKVSCSGGVAELGPDGSSGDALVSIADARLYATKNARNQRVAVL